MLSRILNYSLLLQFSKICSEITNITCLHCFMQELWQHENLSPLVYCKHIHFKRLKAAGKIKSKQILVPVIYRILIIHLISCIFFVAYFVSLRILEQLLIIAFQPKKTNLEADENRQLKTNTN